MHSAEETIGTFMQNVVRIITEQSSSESKINSIRMLASLMPLINWCEKLGINVHKNEKKVKTEKVFVC